jgi:hypothetical protein
MSEAKLAALHPYPPLPRSCATHHMARVDSILPERSGIELRFDRIDGIVGTNEAANDARSD